jgi:hypothetical protein
MTHTGQQGAPPPASASGRKVWFDRRELDLILWAYGKRVAEGECRDYAIGAHSDHAAFCMYRGTSEAPAWIVEKRPDLARRQGAYSVSNAAGLVLRRGHDLQQVLRVFDRRRLSLVD